MGAGKNLAGIHALVVDDHLDSRDLLERLLEYLGAFVVTSHSADDAVQELSRLAFDVVITDMNLGAGGDGASLLREARRRGDKTPFIAISVADFDPDELRRQGFSAYLRKPLEHEHLVRTIWAVTTRTGEAR